MPAHIQPWPERFWKYVNKTESCWLWTGAIRGGSKTNDYGCVYSRISEKYESAHRVSWELANGPIPQGKKVLHKCDVRKCVNPAHLYVGTAKENTRDMIERGRMVTPEQAALSTLRKLGYSIETFEGSNYV